MSAAENQTDRPASTAVYIDLRIITDVESGCHRHESSSSDYIYCIARIGCDTADTHRYGLLSEPVQQLFDGGGMAAFEFEEAVTPG